MGISSCSHSTRPAVPLTLQHVDVRVVCNGEYVWWHLGASFATVHVDDLFSIDWEVPVGVNDHTEKARVGLKISKNAVTQNSMQ